MPKVEEGSRAKRAFTILCNLHRWKEPPWSVTTGGLLVYGQHTKTTERHGKTI
ncbi:hypothetical protein ZEAMMB73_Zm00001d046582, partial [Zea mays]